MLEIAPTTAPCLRVETGLVHTAILLFTPENRTDWRWTDGKSSERLVTNATSCRPLSPRIESKSGQYVYRVPLQGTRVQLTNLCALNNIESYPQQWQMWCCRPCRHRIKHLQNMPYTKKTWPVMHATLQLNATCCDFWDSPLHLIETLYVMRCRSTC